MNEVIGFLRAKDYKYVNKIGQGGTGKTVLLHDELIDENFVCKKYSPLYEEYKEEFYKNFVDEIKILHLLFHDNIVRVFNYYLYPEYTTGYILMEYINGESISEYIKNNPEKLNDIFEQVINGFKHLEENKILHRDIRPANILVSKKGIVKIIDFGFGKKINFEESYDNSISLNWRYSIPKDFDLRKYDFKTEVYFVGKLFEEIIQNLQLDSFKYSSILLGMIKKDPEERINSFFDVYRKLISGEATEIEFSKSEKEIYADIANSISITVIKIEEGSTYIKDINEIQRSLEECYRNSMLEDYVQNPISVLRCFIEGQYYYSKNAEIKVVSLKEFIKFLKSINLAKKKIVINNLWNRFDRIERYHDSSQDDLPF